MIPRKRKRLLIIAIIAFIIITITATLAFLYLNTDLFKSNQTLFCKYFAQNFDGIKNVVENQPEEISKQLEDNKYTSNLKVNIEYTANKNTSDENKNNPINLAELNIDSQIDCQNKYDYKNIRLAKENENIAKAEYIQDNSIYGIRLEGIKQFVSIDTNNMDEIAEKVGTSQENLEKIPEIFGLQNLWQILEFSEEEKQILANTYLEIIEQNTDKTAYEKTEQGIKLIKNEQEVEIEGENIVQANAYSIKMTKEKFNNLLVQILQKMITDEIILGKLDNIENKMQNYKVQSEEDGTSIREKFVNYLEENIENIKSKNIGQEETQIIVYEVEGSTVRTEIITDKQKLRIDLYNQQNSIEIVYTKNENNVQQEKIIKIQKTRQDTKYITNITYNKLNDGKQEYGVSLKINQEQKEEKITREYVASMGTESDEIVIKANETINIVQEFEDKIELSTENNVTINSLEKEKIETIFNILVENIENQKNNIDDKIPFKSVEQMLVNLGIMEEKNIDFSQTDVVSETERNRFNTEFTFFIGEKMSAEHVKELLETAKDSLKDFEVIEENKENSEEKQLKEIKLKIQRDENNEEVLKQVEELIEKNKGEKFDITMSYDENTKLINNINLTINRNK